MRRDQLPRYSRATFVVPRWKLVYVPVAKAACTSMKGLIADLNGEDLAEFRTSLQPEVSRATTLHHRRLWQRTPTLRSLSDEKLATISSDDGWFVFAVVRHPVSRLWSAWQSKFLLREPGFVGKFADAPWLPRVPRSTSEVVEDFRHFVRVLREEPGGRILENRHFHPQRSVLTPERTPYTRIYRTDEIPELLNDLDKHVRAQGGPGVPALRSSNDTPLAPLRSMFTAPVLDTIAQVYREDLEAFGFDEPLPDGVPAADGYDAAQLREVGRLVERSERIGDLAVAARRLSRENQALAAQVARLQADAAGR